MGVVYKAEDIMLNRMVALKAILPALGASANVKTRFLREARRCEREDCAGHRGEAPHPNTSPVMVRNQLSA